MPRHYVVVVHGIGEQKLNETTVEVIHRFAEARQGKPQGYFQHMLPANISSQSVRRRGHGHGWSEFRGIPVNLAVPTGAFDGTPATDGKGENFRFVDMWWADILQRQQRRYASPAEVWAPRLNQRLRVAPPKGWIPGWARRMLQAIEEAALPVKKLLAFYKPELAQRIFEGFLGDVHLYGDYTRARGWAVRRFHAILDEIQLGDFLEWSKHHTEGDYEPPEFTVIAHSLGSIMSFDALTYAFATPGVRRGVCSDDHPCPSLPFPGYTEPWVDEGETEGEYDTWRHLLAAAAGLREQAEGDGRTYGPRWRAACDAYYRIRQALPAQGRNYIPPLMWRDRVRNLVTLGSPIDKYHVVWYPNYFHMGLRRKNGTVPPAFRAVLGTRAQDWMERSPERRIVHYNLCDEQDPVGHHLDTASASENYGEVFETDNRKLPVAYRDVVFRRYALPGAAHVMYWGDLDLFRGILEEVVDEGKNLSLNPREFTPNEDPGLKRGYFLSAAFRETRDAYRKALAWAYFRVPFVAAVLTAALLIYGLYLDGELLYRIAAVAGAVLLWTKPSPVKEYKEEGRPERGFPLLVSFLRRWRFRRGILAHLVSGAVAWRRILIRLNADGATRREDCFPGAGTGYRRLGFETLGGFRRSAWWRYLLAALVWAGSGYARGIGAWTSRLSGWGGTLVESVFLASALYLIIMLYVAYCFGKEKSMAAREDAAHAAASEEAPGA